MSTRMIVPVLAAGLALAGCGSAATSATTAANSDYSKALQFTACMRAHGETNFPDPTFNGGGARLELSKSSGLDPSSPTFKAAQQACGSLIGKQVPQRAP